jgi:hypothetical protein
MLLISIMYKKLVIIAAIITLSSIIGYYIGSESVNLDPITREYVPPDPLENFSHNDIQFAALSLLQLPYRCDSIGDTISVCDQYIARLPILREKYKNYKSKKMRNEINNWLSFYSDKYNSQKKDMQSPDYNGKNKDDEYLDKLTSSSKEIMDKLGE